MIQEQACQQATHARSQSNERGEQVRKWTTKAQVTGRVSHRPFDHYSNVIAGRLWTLETGRAWRQQLTDAGMEAVLTSDHPLDGWGRGDIALRVPPGHWSEANELLEPEL